MLLCLAWALALVSVSLASAISIVGQDIRWDYFCGRQTYGSPDLLDCHPLLESFATYNDNLQRVFDEEEMRVNKAGSWPGVLGIVGAALLDRVIQVPRYYTMSMCDQSKMALLGREGADVLIMSDFQTRATLQS